MASNGRHVPFPWGSSVGIVTELRAERSGLESRWGRDFPPVQTGPGAHSASCKMGTESFPGVKCGRGVLLTTHPLLVPRSWKTQLYLYPPSGPHQACNGITLPLPLPLLLLFQCRGKYPRVAVVCQTHQVWQFRLRPLPHALLL